MLQRINTVLIALVAIGLIVVGIGTWQQQSRTTAAFEMINEKLTGLAAPQVEPLAPAAEPEPQQPIEQVYVDKNDGSSQYPVAYTSELTVANALRGTIGDQSPVPVEQFRVDIFTSTPQGDGSMVLRNVLATTDYELQPWDRIAITGADAELPWLLYSPSASDAAALEAISTEMFEAAADDPDQISLQRIFEISATSLELRLVIDPDDLEYHDYNLDRTIPRAFLEKLTFKQVMDYACQTTGFVNYGEMLWDVHDGQLLVGSARAIADRALTTATYRVDNLLGPFPNRDSHDSLKDILIRYAGFDTWREYGGDISIYSVLDDRLSITTIPHYHRSIVSMLEMLHDPDQQYARDPIRDETAMQTFTRLSSTSIGEGLSAQTSIREAIKLAIERAELAYHIDEHQLEMIGFEGERTIVRTPDSRESAARLIGEWLDRGSPDDFDRAAWMAYGGGVAVSSQRSLDRMKRIAVYDLHALKNTVDREFKDNIIRFIQTRVNFDGWRDNGGDTGIIQNFKHLLVISAPEAMHRDIVKLLDEYRANAG